MTHTGRLRSWLLWIADWQILPVGLLSLPVFFFPDRLPLGIQPLVLFLPVLLCFLHWLARGCLFRATPLDLPLWIWLLTLPLGLWASPLPEISLPLLFRQIIAIAFFYALVNSLNTPHKLRLATVSLLVGTALLAVVGLLGMQRPARFGILPAGLTRQIPSVVLSFWNRASTGFNANITGGLLAIFVPITIVHAWASLVRPRTLRRAIPALVLWLLAAAETLVLLFTQSRGALVGFAAALVTLAIARDRRWAWLVPLVAVGIAVTLAVVGPKPAVELVFGGLAANALSSAEARLELFSRGLDMLQDFPFTGVGLGMFSRMLPLLYPLFLVGPDTEISHSHNIVLQAGIEHGFPGLVAFLALLLLLVVIGIQAVRLSRGRTWQSLAIGLLAGLIAFLIHGIVDVISASPRAQMLIWAHWGLLAAVWRLAQPPAGESDG